MSYVRNREQRSTARRRHDLQVRQGRWLLVRDDDGEVRVRIDTTHCESCSNAEACERCRRKADAAMVAVNRYDSWQGFSISSTNLVKYMLGGHNDRKENR